MIRVKCPNCLKIHTLPDNYYGKRGKCNQCNHRSIIGVESELLADDQQKTHETQNQKVVISGADLSNKVRAEPQSVKELNFVFTSPTKNIDLASQQKLKPKLTMRVRRLISDHESIKLAFDNNELIQVVLFKGSPPELYRVRYRNVGVIDLQCGNPVLGKDHLIEIQLTSEYPRQSPKCKILTKIFHPNFDPISICVGDHWTAQESLVDLVIRIGEMISFQSYNIKSPLNGEAAMWADLNRHMLPVDNRPITQNVNRLILSI